jgi:predicted RNA-binding Zn ribbon-like protein
VRWGRRLGVFGARRPEPVDDAELAATRELRLAIHATFTAIARGETPPPAALQTIAHTHAIAAADARLTASDGAWTLQWPARDPRRVRFAVSVDAVALLRDRSRLARVRRCPGRDCGWLFLDASGRRRWCSMTTCGSREKMRRMYERRRATRSPAPARSRPPRP